MNVLFHTDDKLTLAPWLEGWDYFLAPGHCQQPHGH